MPIIKTYSDNFKLQKITEYMQSNVSMGDFCIQNQIKKNTFKAWYYEYLKQRKSWDAISEKSDDPAEIIMTAAKELTEEDCDTIFRSKIVIMKLNDASFSFDVSIIHEVIGAIRKYD